MPSYMKHITRALILPFFLMYALSPLYLSSMSDGAGIADLHRADNNVTVGIVWLSSLIDSIVPEDDMLPMRGIHAVQAEQDDVMILIKKKRVLARESYKLRPILQLILGTPVQAENPVSVDSTFDIRHDLIHNHSDGYYSLSTGLSPPSLLP